MKPPASCAFSKIPRRFVMKKLLTLAFVLLAAVLVNSAPASAQVVIGIGHRGVVVAPAYPVYPAYVPSYDYCGVDAYGNPVLCAPVAPYPYDYGYYGYYSYGRDYRGYGRDYRGYRYEAPRGYNGGGYRGGFGGGYGNRGGNGGGHGGRH